MPSSDSAPRPRLEQRDTSPAPHPAVHVDPGADELRRRMGEYVRTLLISKAELSATGWPIEIQWDERTVWATLTRGELVISTDWTRATWWLPQRKSAAAAIAEGLARVLLAYHRLYTDADETGRIRDGDVLLEPGVRKESGGASAYGVERYCRMGEHVALPREVAVETGWIREVADYSEQG